MDDETPYPPRFWWLKRGCISALLVGVALVAVHFIYAHHAESLYQRAIAQAKARGEAVDLSEFDDPPAGPEANAANDYRKAITAISAAQVMASEWQIQDNAPATLLLPASDVAPTAALMKRLRPMLDSARMARRRKVVNWGLKWRDPNDVTKIVSQYGGYRSLANLLELAAAHQHTIGNDHEAMEIARDIQALSQAVDKQSLLISHLVAIAIDSTGTSVVDAVSAKMRYGNGGGEVTAADVRSMTDYLLDDPRSMRAAQRALLAERAFLKVETFPWSSYKPYAKVQYARYLEATEPIIAATTIAEYPKAKAMQATLRPVSNIFHDALVQLVAPSYGRYINVDFRSRAAKHLTAAKLAISAYRAEHNKIFPPALGVLVPEYLPRVPEDPYTVKDDSVKYRPAATMPSVYSVYENGNDDNGNHGATQPSATPFSDPDLLYPLNSPAR